MDSTGQNNTSSSNTSSDTRYQLFYNDVDLEAGGGRVIGSGDSNSSNEGGCCQSKTCQFLSSTPCRIMFYILIAMLLSAGHLYRQMQIEQNQRDIIKQADEIAHQVSFGTFYFILF